MHSSNAPFLYDTFTDPFSNINIDSIQETYPKISVYNRVIAHYMEETNKVWVKFEIYQIRSPRGRPMGKNISGCGS